MEGHTPIYPLPMEIQQMEQSETVCQYCGVSYLILHEIQRLQEELKAAEQELEERRGAAERERELRAELQEASARLAELRASHLEQAERVKGLDLQLVESRSQLKSVSAETAATERELGKAHGRCQLLRGRSQLQVQTLRTAQSLLRSCRQELHDVQRSHTQLFKLWEGWSVQLLQTSQVADAERAELERALGGAQVEVTRLRDALTELDLASSETVARDQEVQTQLLELKEKVKSLHLDLQGTQSERERLKTLLLSNSKETEELHFRQIQFEKEQREINSRLSEDLRDREERWLSCQRRCQSLQEELIDLERREEEVTQKHMQADSENQTIRRSLQRTQEEITTLKEESERTALAHGLTVQQLEGSLRQQKAEGKEQRAQAEASLQRERSQLGLQLKEKEQELRREAEMELHIEREKNQELLQEYQREAEQLRRKLPSLVHEAARELRAELTTAKDELREVQEGRAEQEERREGEALRLQSTVSELEQQLLRARGDGQRGALQLVELRQELEQMRQETSVLQEENTLLQETVRRECEERGELTAALTLAREQLLELRHSPPHTNQRPHPLGPGGPRGSMDRRTKGGEGSSGERSEGAWHSRGVGRTGAAVTLPRLSQERTASVNQARHRISLVMGRKERS